MKSQATILIVDDASEFLRETSAVLRPHFRVSTCSSPVRALRLVGKGRADLLITTLVMRELDGFEVIRRVRGSGATIPVIMVTGHGDENPAIEAIRVGANDYLNRPVEPEELLARVRRALAPEEATSSIATPLPGSPVVVTRDPQMLRVLELCGRAARSESRVLILGETGTGKELLAKTIHALGPRRDSPLVEVNCAAIPANLIESELFGHEKGAFTGAVDRRPGRFEEAGSGTLFLDEIGELNHSLQSKLLRVLQSGEYNRVGSSKVMRSRARIIAATHRDLEQEALAGRFRPDLFHRLNVVTLFVPPLRERSGDIPVLLDHFNARFSHGTSRELNFSPAAVRLFRDYPWPGNVRELEHLMERLAVLSAGEQITPEHLPPHIQLATASPPSPSAHLEGQAYGAALREFDLNYFRAVIEAGGGNLAAAARTAGMDRSQFFRKITTLGLHTKKAGGKRSL